MASSSSAESSEGGGQKLGGASRTILETSSCPPEMKNAHPVWSFQDFRLQRVLGEGAMSTVVLCTCARSGAAVAIKVYHRDRMNGMNVRQVAREIEIHASLLHPNVVKLYAAFEDAEAIYLVQEFAARGDLYLALSRRGGYMPEAYVVKVVLLPFLSALTYLHAQGVLHRDIKPENVMVGEEGEPRIGDFGLAINTLREKPMSRVGTLDYMPPEIVRLPGGGASGGTAAAAPEPDDPPANYGLPVDVWCVGILAYELLVGGPPFEAASKEATYTRILKTEPFLPSHLSAHARDFVLLTLRKEPAQRPTVQQLLRHPWLKSYRRPNSMHSVEPTLPQQPAAPRPAAADAPAPSRAAPMQQAASAAAPAAATAAPKAAAPSAPAPALPKGVAMMPRAISFNSTLTKRFPAALPATGPVAVASHPKLTRAAQLPESHTERKSSNGTGSGCRGDNAAPTITAAGGDGGDGPRAIAAVPGTDFPLEALKAAGPGAARALTIVRVDAAPASDDQPLPEATRDSGAASVASAAAAECASEREGGGYIKAGHQSQQQGPAAASEQGEPGAGLTFMALLEQKLSAATRGADACCGGGGAGGGALAGWGRSESLGGGIASMQPPSLAALLTPPPAASVRSRHFSGTKFLRAFGKKLSLGYSKAPAPRSSAADLVVLGRTPSRLAMQAPDA